MWRWIFTALVTAMAGLTAGSGQVTGLTIDRHGKFFVTVYAGRNTYVTVSGEGEVFDIDTRARLTYNNSIFDHLDGKVKSAGDIDFDYYHSIFDYQNGKLKQVGDIRFEYWDSFDEAREGRLKSVGDVKFEYFDRFTLDETKRGLPKTIGPLRFDFYGDTNPGRSAGLLKTIGPKRYTYRGNSMDGAKEFEIEGIHIHVVDRHGRGKRR